MTQVAELPTPSAAADSESEGGARISRAAWLTLGVLMLLYCIAMLDRQIVALMVGPVKHELGINDFQISLLQGLAFTLLYSTCGIPLGYAADRFPRRIVIFAGVMLWALAATACGLAQNFNQLLLARFLVGAGEAALVPAAVSILADMFPRGRMAIALSIFSMGATTGVEIALVGGGFLMELGRDGVTLPLIGTISSWRFAFLATGIPGLAAAFLIFLIPEPQRRAQGEAKAGSDWGHVFRFMKARWGFFACHFLAFSCIMAMSTARLAWSPTYVVRTFGWSIADAGLTLGTFGFINGMASFAFSGWLIDRMVRRGVKDAHLRYYVLATPLLIVFGSLAYWSASPVIYFSGMTIASFALALGGVTTSSLAFVSPPQFRGRIVAIYGMVSGLLGATIGPAMVGYMNDNVFGATHISVSLTVSYLILGPLALLLFVIGLAPMRRLVAASQDGR